MCRAFAQEAVEAVGVFGFGDFARVGRADGGDVAGVVQPRFEVGHLSVEFEAVGAEHVGRQAEFGEVVAAEDARVGDVVDGKDGFDRDVPGVQVGECQAALPVVPVDEVGFPPAVRARGQRGAHPAEQAEAQVVVAVVGVVLVVVGVAVAAVEVRRFDEVEADAVVVGVADFDVAREGMKPGDVAGFADAFGDAGVHGQDDAHVHAALLLGKR